MSNGSWFTVLGQPLGDDRRRLPKQESEQVLRQAKRQVDYFDERSDKVDYERMVSPEP